MINPANRISNVEEYYFSTKLKEIDRMRAEGKDVINLGIGNPDFPPAPEVLEKLNESSLNAKNHGYQSYIGIPELRNAFADWYKKYFNVTLDSNSEILPLMGSKEGVMHISMAFLNQGDEVLLPNPGYPTYTSVTKLVGAVPLYYDLKEENNWQPDFNQIENNDLSKVKLMWVNYPNMPTGAAANENIMRKLIAFGKKHNILICNDNPYSFILNPKQFSILSIDGAKDIAIELNSLSKSHNMAGWRMGMVASNPEFISYILRVKSNMDSGMFRPLQEATALALSLDDNWYQSINKTYRERRIFACKLMDLLNCSYDRNQVGMFIWGRIPDGMPNGSYLSDIILQKANVFITPGIIFGSNGDKYIRISLCTKEELLEEAIARIQLTIDNENHLKATQWRDYA